MSGYVDPSRPNPNGPNDAPIIIYGYVPSLILAIIASITFGLSTLTHFFQIIRYRTWWFLVIPVGTAMEVVGYAFRVLSNVEDPYNVNFFVIQYFFIVVAPVLFSAGIYLILNKIMLAGNVKGLLTAKAILAVFIVFDVVTTIIQIAGAASIGNAESQGQDPTKANDVLLAGLAIQVASFAFFIIVLTAFVGRFLKSVAEKSEAFRNHSNRIVWILIITSSLVELRTIFRLLETAQGVLGFLSTHENYFATLEYLPIILVVVIFNIFHPGSYLAMLNSNSEQG